MTKKQLQTKIANLESVNDQLLTEIHYLDGLMREVGFNDGLRTFKAAASEITSQGLELED